MIQQTVDRISAIVPPENLWVVTNDYLQQEIRKQLPEVPKLGCWAVQSQSCHTDRCPTGVATQDPSRQRALVVGDKSTRVAHFHRATLQSLAELTAAAGTGSSTQFNRSHISRRLSPREVATFAELYPALAPGELLTGTSDARFGKAWQMAGAETFRAVC